MALYDYKCVECHSTYTVEHSVNETPDVLCVTCKKSMRKLFSAPAVSFKGNGWGHQ
jgi:putative FmdB family regulatory protein